MTRRSHNILSEQSRNTEQDESRHAALQRMVGLAEQMHEALTNHQVDGFGEVLHANWMEKRRLANGITQPRIDRWYEAAREHGAIGGKILGAGGGGFLLLYAPRDRHQDICKSLPELRPVPFHFEPQGSKLIYVEENGYV